MSYVYVDMGPMLTMPDGSPTPAWHPLVQPYSLPFPNETAAQRFATAHRLRGRSVTVRGLQ